MKGHHDTHPPPPHRVPVLRGRRSRHGPARPVRRRARVVRRDRPRTVQGARPPLSRRPQPRRRGRRRLVGRPARRHPRRRLPLPGRVRGREAGRDHRGLPLGPLVGVRPGHSRAQPQARHHRERERTTQCQSIPRPGPGRRRGRSGRCRHPPSSRCRTRRPGRPRVRCGMGCAPSVRRWCPPTAATGCSSSPALPTPKASDWRRGPSPSELRRNDPSLPAISGLLPTPNASDATGGGQHPSKRVGHSRQLIYYALSIGDTTPTPSTDGKV